MAVKWYHRVPYNFSVVLMVLNMKREFIIAGLTITFFVVLIVVLSTTDQVGTNSTVF